MCQATANMYGEIFPMISFMTEQCDHKGVHKYKEMNVANMNSKY